MEIIRLSAIEDKLQAGVADDVAHLKTSFGLYIIFCESCRRIAQLRPKRPNFYVNRVHTLFRPEGTSLYANLPQIVVITLFFADSQRSSAIENKLKAGLADSVTELNADFLFFNGSAGLAKFA